jgi:two-component system, NtrC family, sensor kinase
METEPIKILVVTDDKLLAGQLESGLQAANLPVMALCPGLGAALIALQEQSPEVVLLDLGLADSQGLDAFTVLRGKATQAAFIILAADNSEAMAHQAVRQGAKDYVLKSECQRLLLGRLIHHVVARERGERNLRESEERFKRLLASTTDYNYSVTVKQGQAVATSHRPGSMAITGYTPQDFEQDPYLWFRMIHEADRQAVLTQVYRVLGGETPPPLEHRIYHKNGNLRWIRNTLVPHLDEQRQVVAYDGLISDITEQKEAEMALQASQERLALVIRGSTDGIWDWDLITDQVYYSPRWKSMLGYAEDEIENHFSAWKGLLHPEDRERALAHLQAYLDGKSAGFELEHRLRHKDGSYRWILARGVLLCDGQGRPMRMAGSHMDLTDRKRAEENLQRANLELARGEEALRKTVAELQMAHEELKVTQRQLIQAARLESVGTLVAGVAHEVKNPLQTILMGLDYLAKNVIVRNATVTSVLTDMREAVNRAKIIVHELLQLSAAVPIEMRAEDFNQVVENSLLLVEYELDHARINVVKNLARSLPPVQLNRSKIQQVFVNVLINAIQAMPEGGQLTVSTRVESWSGAASGDKNMAATGPVVQNAVVVDVEDTGVGIPEENLVKVFDPFFTTKPVGTGTGLGLSVAKKIMDLHGGTIELRNVPGGGVMVTLRLKAT